MQKSIEHLIAETAGRFVERTAVRCGNRSLTYQELLCRANGIADVLVKQGVREGSLVGIYMERSVFLPVAMLGVLRSGAAYVPMDPTYPEQRIRWMVEDASMELILTDEASADEVRQFGAEPMVAESVDALPECPVPEHDASERLAYVIFTSGSTGRPKGVQIPRRALSNFLCSMRETPGMTEHDVLLSVTTLSFDISGLEMFLPLLVGGQLVVATREAAMDGQALIRLVRDEGITLMQATPVTWKLMLAAGWDRSPGLKVLCGGEAFPRDLADQLLQKAGEVWNMYGPTETTIWSTCDRVAEERGPVSIGRPVANTTVYVVDDHLKPVADGEEGELVIGGDGLSLGYLGLPELNREKFTALTTTGEAVYRTGDIAKVLPDGRLLCLGRIDHQVKLRGHRIELGEIESLLRRHEAVRDAVVSLYEGGEPKLVAYIVPDENGEHTDRLFAALGDALKGRLPGYMIPSGYVLMNALPHTPNGKVDRKALPAPADVQTDVVEVEYASFTEEVVAGIWRELLDVASVPRDADFFDLGGNSLTGTKLFILIREKLDVDISMAALVRHSTLKGLAAEVEQYDELLDERLAACDSLKVLNPGNPAMPPLVLVHAGDGRTLPFKDLMDNLDPEQPVYAFRWSGQDGRLIDPDLKKQARDYASELLTFNPGGTFWLGGFCHGGLVAPEMARHVREGGGTVLDPLIIFGAPNVHASSYRRREPLRFGRPIRAFRERSAALARLKISEEHDILDYESPYSENLLIHMVKSSPVYSALRRGRVQRRLDAMNRLIKNGQELPVESRDWYCGSYSTIGIMAYRCSAYDGDVLFFQCGACHGKEVQLAGWWDSPYLGFEEICRGRFEGVVLGGPQVDLLKHPMAADIIMKKIKSARTDECA